jgi:hypothetical protein
MIFGSQLYPSFVVVKRSRETKDQSVGPSDEKLDEEDLEQEEPPPNPEAPLHTMHQRRRFLNIDIDPCLDLLPYPLLNPIEFPINCDSPM